MNYQEQAKQFAQTHKITLSINGCNYGKHFTDDKESRYIFNCTLKHNRKRYTFNFGQSIAAGMQEPTMYDVLSCLQKYEVGTFDDFCSAYGYNNDSIKAHKTYLAVDREYKNMLRVFGSELLEQMQGID